MANLVLNWPKWYPCMANLVLIWFSCSVSNFPQLSKLTSLNSLLGRRKYQLKRSTDDQYSTHISCIPRKPSKVHQSNQLSQARRPANHFRLFFLHKGLLIMQSCGSISSLFKHKYSFNLVFDCLALCGIYPGAEVRPGPWTCWVWGWSPALLLSPSPSSSGALAAWPCELLPPAIHRARCAPLLHTYTNT